MDLGSKYNLTQLRLFFKKHTTLPHTVASAPSLVILFKYSVDVLYSYFVHPPLSKGYTFAYIVSESSVTISTVVGSTVELPCNLTSPVKASSLVHCRVYTKEYILVIERTASRFVSQTCVSPNLFLLYL